MANGDSNPPSNPTNRDVWAAVDRVASAVERLREDTSNARHAQNNQFQGMFTRLDDRLRELERMMDSSQPVSLGPRINALEQWRAEMRGGMASIRLVAVVASILSAAAAVISLVRS